MTSTLFVTGGAGFIGANLVKLLHDAHPQAQIVVIDKLTYAGNLDNLGELLGQENVHFEKVDIAKMGEVAACFERWKPTGIYHLAAESHVDRSISGPGAFIESNIVGTFCLLECARTRWSSPEDGRFLHVSTDEVFGSLGEDGAFDEDTPYDPSSPYSASKAASDHLVRAYHRTYGLNAVLTNCSNNFGPYQYPEKLIPVIIRNIRDKKPLPVYGKGVNVRDWLYVEDHCHALHQVFHKGRSGRSYNIGTENEWRNIDLVELLCDLTDEELGRPAGSSRELITFVTDRPGHDARYAIDPSRIRSEIGWEPKTPFDRAIRHTVRWYLEHLGPLWGM